MRKIAVICFLFLIPSVTHAAVTEADIKTLIATHNATLSTCNPAEVVNHLNTNFTSGYTVTGIDLDGQRETATKQQMIDGLRQMAREEDLSQLTPEMCTPAYQVTEIKTDGNLGSFTTIQQDEFTVTEGGQRYLYNRALICLNSVQSINGSLKITKTVCQAQQSRKEQ